MDTKIKKYLKREFYHGKSLPARLFDAVFLKILAFMVIFLFFWLMRAGFWQSVLLAAAVVGSFGILKFVFTRSRYQSFSEKKKKAAGVECALEKFMLLDREHVMELVCRACADLLELEPGELNRVPGGFLWERTYCAYFDVHPKSRVGINSMIRAMRVMHRLHARKAVMITPGSFDAEARAMAMRRSEVCTFVEREELMELLGSTRFYPADEEIYAFLAAEAEEKRVTRQKLRDAFFSTDKGRSFALCAFVLIILPLITGFSPIYPISAAVCTGLSVYGFVKGRDAKKKN